MRLRGKCKWGVSLCGGGQKMLDGGYINAECRRPRRMRPRRRRICDRTPISVAKVALCRVQICPCAEQMAGDIGGRLAHGVNGGAKRKLEIPGATWRRDDGEERVATGFLQLRDRF